MENELDYPTEGKEEERCTECNKLIQFDDFGAYCDCGYR